MRQPAMSILMANKAAKSFANRTEDFIDIANKEHRSLFFDKLSHVLTAHPDLVPEEPRYTHVIDCSIDIHAHDKEGKSYKFKSHEMRRFNRQIALLLSNRLDEEKYDIIVGKSRMIVFCDKYDLKAMNTYLEFASEAMYQDVRRFLAQAHPQLILDDVTYEGHCEVLDEGIHLVPGMVVLQQAKSTLKMIKAEQHLKEDNSANNGLER